MIVEVRSGLVHRVYDRDVDFVRTVCGELIYVDGPITLCPCEYHKPIVAPTLPSNQTGCVSCFPDGGWHPVKVRYEPPRLPPWPPTTLVDGS